MQGLLALRLELATPVFLLGEVMLAHLCIRVRDRAAVVARALVLFAVSKQTHRVRNACHADTQNNPQWLCMRRRRWPFYQNIPLQSWHVNGRKSRPGETPSVRFMSFWKESRITHYLPSLLQVFSEQCSPTSILCFFCYNWSGHRHSSPAHISFGHQLHSGAEPLWLINENMHISKRPRPGKGSFSECFVCAARCVLPLLSLCV